ncbi:MAG: hypothetical protein KatS3mg068_0294 [Candidatus Sericytochromatia bacterium]|nr:MAG: hypothetical protein KatS3mg068_0294 [Candidatus Sericytochromatia bacterium]
MTIQLDTNKHNARNMLKTYKYRIYPNKVQIELLAKIFGCVRLYLNKALKIKLEALEKKEKIPQVLASDLKKEFESLKEVDSLALANAQLQLKKAFKKWLKDKTHKEHKFKNGFAHLKISKTGNVQTQACGDSSGSGMVEIPVYKSLSLKEEAPCSIARSSSLNEMLKC